MPLGGTAGSGPDLTGMPLEGPPPETPGCPTCALILPAPRSRPFLCLDITSPRLAPNHTKWGRILCTARFGVENPARHVGHLVIEERLRVTDRHSPGQKLVGEGVQAGSWR